MSIVIIFFITLSVYASKAYKASDEMENNIVNIDLTSIKVSEDRDEISYKVDNPKLNIVFIPGGLVDASAYKYLASNLAKDGNNVTIFKTFFHLAILTPNYAKRFINPRMENVIIWHSLGGTVASMIASKNKYITDVILLGSYAFVNIENKNVLLITAENDKVLSKTGYADWLTNAGKNAKEYSVQWGNHGQFGWYGEQKWDWEATISTKDQQDIVISKILEFIHQNDISKPF